MRVKLSKQHPPALTASAVGPCPTVIKIVGRPGTGSLPSTFAPPDHSRQGFRYHKLRKAFSKFYRWHFDIASKYNVGLKLNFFCKAYHEGRGYELGMILEHTQSHTLTQTHTDRVNTICHSAISHIQRKTQYENTRWHTSATIRVLHLSKHC